MHVRDRDYWKPNLHMCTRGTASVDGGFPTSILNSFLKDGRKIKVGDCALFEPHQDSLPFIGLIRCIISGKDSNLKFTVNWLYRASEIELEKGAQVDAAPNEIFYSFHEDEVPAASLLHQCKVAFLPKGVELPSGISSFICRRVYDVNQKCLWWLTDQNYIDKRQEEVDQLLSKTRREMHTTAQPSARSPKTTNDTTLTSLVKTRSDIAQSVSSFSSNAKGKKRERPDQDSEPVKRQAKLDDWESCQPKLDSILKAEIARITDRGGLVDHESVKKLVQLMAPDKADLKINPAGRSMLAGVIAATVKFDCLSLFVQLKGLSVFDEWLQEIHKGKINDGNSYKDGDKSVEEFLLLLLRALDKLPVNLRALQLCNIGKSVNHLRSHKNLEIQRKARSLVDTWKKRVEAEMNIDDGKPGSNMGVAWHGRRTSEESQGVHRNPDSSETAMKRSSSQISAPRIVLPKHPLGETGQATAAISPGFSKSASSPAARSGISKVADKNIALGESPDLLPTSVKDQKSSSSNQSHSQSSSSEHIKIAESSGKEDARISTAGSMGAGDILRHTPRLRKSISGLPGPVSCGPHRDGGSNRSPLHRPSMSEKLSRSGSINEKRHDIPVADGNGHKLIVKIPNRGRSPAMNANGGSLDESCPSDGRALSPSCPGKPEKPYCGIKEKGDTNQLNDASDVTSKSWHSSDLKDVLTGSDEADGASVANLDEVRSFNGDHTKKLNELPKVVSSSAAVEIKSWTTHKPSFCSMNALVESCIKHSEANALISAVDDVGMNLLASVAASEIAMCDSIATISPGNTSVAEDFGGGNSGRSLNVHESSHESFHGTSNMKNDTETQEESTSLMADDGDGLASSDKILTIDLSKVVLAKDQDDGQLSDIRVVVLSEASMELVLDPKVGRQKEIDQAESEISPTEGRHSTVHSSGVHMEKKYPSTAHSDDCESNNKTQTPLGPDAPLDSVKAVVDDERQGERKIVDDNDFMDAMDQKLNKTENCKNDTLTAEIHSVADVSGSATADFSVNYKEGRSQHIEVHGHYNECSDLSNTSVVKMAACRSTNTPCAFPSTGIEKRGFDLNEGFAADDVKCEEQRRSTRPPCPVAVHVMSPLPFSVSTMSSGLTASVTVAAAAKGAFVPPENLLRTRGEVGWKGSAATSAFRPAEPRKIPEVQINTRASPSDAPSKTSRPFLNIDLNVLDDSVQDDMASQCGTGDLPGNKKSIPFGGLDLDLNQVDDANEVGQYSSITYRKFEIAGLSSMPGIPPNGEPSAKRNFDLNNGPMHEDVGVEASTLGQNIWSNMPPQPPVVGLRMNDAEMGNFASWFPQGNVIPAVTIPVVLPDRGDQMFPVGTAGTSHRMYYTHPGSTPLAPDVYKGPVLSSPLGISFPASPYQYPVFPYGASFPVPSATLPGGSTQSLDSSSGGRLNFPKNHSQYLGHPGPISSSYPWPYLLSTCDGRSNGGVENVNRLGSHGLDLNSSIEVESGRNEQPLPFGLRHFSILGSQAAVTMDPARMFQASGVVAKRKGADEGGWDAEKPKQQQSWH